MTATPGLTPKGVKPKQEITPPKAILMERPPPMTAVEMELAQSESALKLVIDAAGKVRSVEVLGNIQAVDEGLIRSTSNWKFIPAFSEGQPVASQIFFGGLPETLRSRADRVFLRQRNRHVRLSRLKKRRRTMREGMHRDVQW